jgi:hypothetical protein
MATTKGIEHAAATLSFDTFWSWLQAHPNCIIRVGTPEAVVYDDDDLHWHFSAEGPDTLLVQPMRGKKLVGEIMVVPADIAYVQSVVGEEDEYVFELISETETDRVASYYFVLSHGYDAQEPVTPGRAVH